MASTETKISKRGDAGTIRDVTFNNSGDTSNNYEAWHFYKPEYHYGSIRHWILDQIWYKEKQGKNYF